MRDWWAPYVGIPFRDGGRDAGGLDCWGLVRLVHARELGIELPAYGEIGARDLARIARTIAARKDDGWVIVDRPRSFDVVLMRSGRSGGTLCVHVGLMANARRLIHVERGAATAVVPLTHWSVAGRILGYRRCRP